MNTRTTAIMALAGAALTLSGCPAWDPDDYRNAPETYVSLKQLVAEHNANAAKVPRLWARAKIMVDLPGLPPIGSTSPLAETNGLLFLSKTGEPARPTNFVIIRKEWSVELFRVGVDSHSIPALPRYYLWYQAGSNSRAMLGRCKFAGAPKVKAVPIDPMQLVEILGVTKLPPVAAGVMPAVVLRMQGKPAAYVVRYLRPQSMTGELKIWREVSFRWSDDEPRRPFRVRLFDADGFCRVVAEVSDYKAIEWDGEDEAAPVMPTSFKIRWPEIKGVQRASAMHIVLSKMSTTHPFGDTIFDFESHLPPGILVEVLDAAYGPERRGRVGK